MNPFNAFLQSLLAELILTRVKRIPEDFKINALFWYFWKNTKSNSILAQVKLFKVFEELGRLGANKNKY